MVTKHCHFCGQLHSASRKGGPEKEDEIFFTNRQQKLTMTVKQQYLVGVAEYNGKRGNVNTFKGMMC